ncbi:hypothetical protein NL676_030317 [Syzygium grande]|nr:hypothetical protein NL676_030317 [Syzygium grande]
MFSGGSDINLYASGKEVVTVKLPSVSSVEGSQVEESNEPTIRHSESKDVPSFQPLPEQIPDLVTLLLLPKSQWQSLINLDIIKAVSPPCLAAASVAPTIPVGVHGCLTTTPTHGRDLAPRYQARPAGTTVSPCINRPSNSHASDDPRSAAATAAAILRTSTPPGSPGPPSLP